MPEIVSITFARSASFLRSERTTTSTTLLETSAPSPHTSVSRSSRGTTLPARCTR